MAIFNSYVKLSEGIYDDVSILAKLELYLYFTIAINRDIWAKHCKPICFFRFSPDDFSKCRVVSIYGKVKPRVLFPSFAQYPRWFFKSKPAPKIPQPVPEVPWVQQKSVESPWNLFSSSLCACREPVTLLSEAQAAATWSCEFTKGLQRVANYN